MVILARLSSVEKSRSHSFYSQSISQPRIMINSKLLSLLSSSDYGDLERVKQKIESHGKSLDEIEDDVGR